MLYGSSVNESAFCNSQAFGFVTCSAFMKKKRGEKATQPMERIVCVLLRNHKMVPSGAGSVFALRTETEASLSASGSQMLLRSEEIITIWQELGAVALPPGAAACFAANSSSLSPFQALLVSPQSAGALDMSLPSTPDVKIKEEEPVEVDSSPPDSPASRPPSPHNRDKVGVPRGPCCPPPRSGETGAGGGQRDDGDGLLNSARCGRKG